MSLLVLSVILTASLKHCRYVTLAALEIEKKKCRYETFTSFFFPLSFPFLWVPSLPGVPSPNPARGSGTVVSFLIWSRLSLTNRRLLVDSELKIMFLVIALLQNFSDNQVHYVLWPMLALRHTSMVLLRKRSSSMVWSLQTKCWYGSPSHFQPWTTVTYVYHQLCLIS